MDALDAELMTPLHCAIVHGHADAARALVHDLKVCVYVLFYIIHVCM